ncbi:hypothetical protein [Pedobacter heparinus]|uniref:Cell wall anchor protein n=1 Tax=Pedobacter heparinus (strain ATCC 13125 / DSM 2366 / CIP 104194 / JCM 7457 / NBRC 12017 / NCIMB 9290 / NRRL B-14731 / HIM 762-3) TaxID=485917 RepID=C6Y3K6_PEDHD|nr:hypothetical protein [Pedobacter heparinus]ACU03285.1 hypothetical protein Phep_1066 [Pedobacter heparinus DSM 2366]
MKRSFLSFALFTIWIFSAQAQIPTAIVTGPGTTYVYVGSLLKSTDDTGNSQKIAIKIIGGSWFSDSNGETNFYISNREGLDIKQVSIGSSFGDRLSLKAYQNSTSIDFYLEPRADSYTSFAVTSFTYGSAVSSQFITITSQTTAPTATDITSSLVISPITMTNGAGDMGIGTNDPKGYKLAVNGKIRTQEIKVENTNWPDYVFTKDYQLPTLRQTEQHIKEKGHLPGIPSAAEVKANGIDLGEMNAKLLQKIEELTLHLIEQNKGQKELQEEVQSLKNEVSNLKSKR